MEGGREIPGSAEETIEHGAGLLEIAGRLGNGIDQLCVGRPEDVGVARADEPEQLFERLLTGAAGRTGELAVDDELIELMTRARFSEVALGADGVTASDLLDALPEAVRRTRLKPHDIETPDRTGIITIV